MHHQHIPRCDCADCLPGLPAAAPPVRKDSTSLMAEPPTEAQLKRKARREKARAAEKKYRETHRAERNERDRIWRRENPEMVRIGNAVARREEREAVEAERLTERYGS